MSVFGCEGAVAVADFASGDGGDSLAGDDDAGEIEGVCGGYGDFVWGAVIAGGVEGCDGLGQGELLAAEARDEAATADLAAGFESAKDAQEFAPFGGVRFAGEQVAEEDAVAGEEHAGEGFESGVGAAGGGDGDGVEAC